MKITEKQLQEIIDSSESDAGFLINERNLKAAIEDFMSAKIPVVKSIEKDGEPHDEVLAIGYQGEVLIGYVGPDTDGENREIEENGYICENEGTILTDVTHYILVSDIVKILFGRE